MTPDAGATVGPASTGGATPGKRGSATRGPDPFLTIPWTRATLSIRTATGEAAPRDAGGGGEAGPSAPAAPGSSDRRPEPRVRGMEFAPKMATLLYFHWPHEDGEKGKTVLKFCTGPMDDPEVVRISWLFHCVQVETQDSQERLLAEAGVEGTPAVLVCDDAGRILWRCDDPKTRPSRLAAGLLSVYEKEFPDLWKKVQERIRGQREGLREAEGLLKKGEEREAMLALRDILESPVRIDDAWEKALKLYRRAEEKVKREE